MQNPTIQQAEKAVQASVTIDADADTVKAFLRNLREQLPTLGLSAELRAEAEADIATVNAQIGCPKPKASVIRQGLECLQRILEGTAGGAAGQLLVELGKILDVG